MNDYKTLYDKNGKPLKIGDYVKTRTNDFGQITAIDIGSYYTFFKVNYFCGNKCVVCFFGFNLELLSKNCAIAQAMLKMLESN